MSPGGPRSDNPYDGDPLADPSLEKPLSALRALAGGQFDVLGALGRDTQGEYAFLAREISRDRLVVLKPGRRALMEDGRGSALQVITQLDSSVPPPAGSCPVCQAPFVNWEPSCPECGAHVAGGSGMGLGASPERALAAVRQAAQGYEVLGTMSRAVGGAAVYFARELSGGHLVALRLEEESVPGGRAGYTVNATRMTQPKLLYGTVGGESAREPGPVPRPWAPVPSPPVPMPAPRMAQPLAAGQGLVSPGPGEKVCPQCGDTFGPELRFCPKDGSVLRAKTTSENLIGRIIGERYHIIDKLGEGGMGAVYLAEHVRMGRRCAVKVMNAMLLHDPDSVSRFSREAANASRINHPNVAAIYDFGETVDEIVFLAMEFVEGESLAAALERNRPVPERRAMEIACQVADALNAAHELGIVHRDLKPDNVMVTRSRAGKDLIKVVDFGIAKATRGGQQTVTRTGFVVGTPAYMSPEQILGDPLDGRSDLYSLGCILYEMLTGERAFAGPSGEVSMRRRLTEPAPRPRKVKRTLSRSLDRIVTKAMARSPDQRFQSANQLRDALVAALSEQPSRQGWRRWLAREREDESTEYTVPSPPQAVSPGLLRHQSAPTQPLDWAGALQSAHSADQLTKVIRHRSARSEGGHLGWIVAGAAGIVLIGFSTWFFLRSGSLPSGLPSESVSPAADSAPDSSLTKSLHDSSIVERALRADTNLPVRSDSTLPAALPLLDSVASPAVMGLVRFDEPLPPGSRVTVDGKDASISTDGLLSLEPGSRLVRIRAPGFRTAARTLAVASGDTVSFPAKLTKIEQDSLPGSDSGADSTELGAIVVSGKLPEGSEIRVDGWPLPAGVRVSSVPPGSHWVAVQIPGFRPESSLVDLGAGRRVVWRVPKLIALPLAQPEDTAGTTRTEPAAPVDSAVSLDSTPPVQ